MDLQNNMESPKIGLGCHSDTAWEGGGGETVTQNSTDVFMKHNDTKKGPADGATASFQDNKTRYNSTHNH